jgi:hypothetical protein
MTLLNTRHGQYAAVCSLDFKSPPRYYDTFALRDSNGKAGFSQHYPIFSSRASSQALIAQDPVPVKSCWNGIGTLHRFSCRALFTFVLLTDSMKPSHFRCRAFFKDH